jgi:autocrine motility factor receptor
VTDTLMLTATLAHYVQILYLHGISFTLIDAVLFLHMKTVFVHLRDKIIAYRNYRKLAENMKSSYPDVSGEILEGRDEVCPICWDKLMSAKKLPCGHMFHQ